VGKRPRPRGGSGYRQREEVDHRLNLEKKN
jgi:hypothetical protein